MYIVVFDVESLGLHGAGFAVGAVVLDGDGKRVEEFYAACPPELESAPAATREWLEANVVPHLRVTKPSFRALQDAFWAFWRRWADQGAVLLADCAWPVEANFLSACVRGDMEAREWQGPYPLLDLAPILWAKGIDPTGTTERLPDELPVHDPLADARQSARLLLEALKD